MPSITWRARFYEQDDSTVDFTLTVSDFAKAPGRVGAQNVRVVDGRAEGAEWTILVQDVAGTFTGRLGDGSGNPDKQMRLVDIQRDYDGGGWETLATGRVTSIHQTGNPLVFRVGLSDERTLERRVTIFNGADTCRLWPRGVRADGLTEGRGYPIVSAPLATFKVLAVASQEVTLTLDEEISSVLAPFYTAMLDVLEEDLLPDTEAEGSPFRFLRLRTLAGVDDAYPYEEVAGAAGVDHEVLGFWLKYGRPENLSAPGTFHADLSGPRKDLRNLLRVKVDWNGTVPSVNDRFRVYYYCPGRPPDDLMPLHIGYSEVGTGSFPTWSVDLATLLKDIFDGAYQGDNPTTLRYESATFSDYNASTNPQGLVNNPNLPRSANRFRITRPWGLYEFSEAVYAATGLVGFVNAANEIAPRRVLQANATDIPDVDLVTVIDDSDLRSPDPPTWRQTNRNRITVVEFRHETVTGTGLLWGFSGDLTLPPLATPPKLATLDSEPREGLDGLTATDSTFEVEHEDVATAGRFVLSRKVDFLQSRGDLEKWTAAHAAQVFQRWRYGAIETEVDGKESLHALDRGDFVLLRSDAYPNVGTGARGGDRLMQVVNRAQDIEGPHLWLLDVGPKLQPLSAPTLALVKNATYSYSHVDATITPTAGDGFELQFAAAASQPADDSGVWTLWDSEESTSGAVNRTYGPLPAGLNIYGRVRATRAERIASAWSSVQTVTLDSLSPPTGFAVSEITGSTALLTWTNGEDRYGIEVLLDSGSGWRLVKAVGAGTTRFALRGLAASTAYTGVGVRHFGPLGARSTVASAGLTTIATLPDLLPPGLGIILGNDVGERLVF